MQPAMNLPIMRFTIFVSTIYTMNAMIETKSVSIEALRKLFFINRRIVVAKGAAKMHPAAKELVINEL